MARGKPIGPKDADQALRLIAEGKTLSEIATTIGLSYSGLHRALTETWPDEYLEAKQRRDDAIRNRVWDIGMEPMITTKEGHAEVADTQSMRWALDHLIKWHLPEAKETQRLELTGGVEVSHPDVAAAIERFTTRVLSLATTGRTGIAHELAAGPSESGPGIPVAELDRPADTGGAAG